VARAAVADADRPPGVAPLERVPAAHRNPVEGNPPQPDLGFHDTAVPRAAVEYSRPGAGRRGRGAGRLRLPVSPAPEQTRPRALLDNHRHQLAPASAWPGRARGAAARRRVGPGPPPGHRRYERDPASCPATAQLRDRRRPGRRRRHRRGRSVRAAPPRSRCAAAAAVAAPTRPTSTASAPAARPWPAPRSPAPTTPAPPTTTPRSSPRARDIRIDVGYQLAHPRLTVDGRDTGVDASRGLAIGLAVPGQLLGARLAVGAGLFLPDQHITRTRTLASSQPRFALYDNRPQRLFLAANLATRCRAASTSAPASRTCRAPRAPSRSTAWSASPTPRSASSSWRSTST
jgi:hypothetical protein